MGEMEVLPFMVKGATQRAGRGERRGMAVWQWKEKCCTVWCRRPGRGGGAQEQEAGVRPEWKEELWSTPCTHSDCRGKRANSGLGSQRIVAIRV